MAKTASLLGAAAFRQVDASIPSSGMMCSISRSENVCPSKVARSFIDVSDQHWWQCAAKTGQNSGAPRYQIPLCSLELSLPEMTLSVWDSLMDVSWYVLMMAH